MTQPLNGAAETKLDPLVSLAGRLTEPQDRETYAALVSYVHSLPPGDEFRRLAELLGFLSLLGQRLPDALAEFLQALREQTGVADEYRATVDERLARLPGEIAAGVNPESIARAMSEAFRQQIAATGLDDTARLLSASVAGLRKLSGELSESLRPVTNQYVGIGTTISTELTRLTNASARLRQHSTDLIDQAAEERWLRTVLLWLVILGIGFFGGLTFEKRSTENALKDLEAQMVQIQARPPAKATAAEAPPVRKPPFTPETARKSP